MIGNHSSPGTYTHEYDLTQRVRSEMSTKVVVVGEASRGPVGQRTLTTSDKAFVQTFGKPNAKLGFAVHSALAALQEATQVYFTRVAPGSKYAGLVCSFDGKYNRMTSWDVGTALPLEYQFEDDDLFIVYASSQGVWANALAVALVPDTRDLNSNRFTLVVYEGDSTLPVEQYLVSLDYQVDGFGKQMQIAEHINQRSSRIQIAMNPYSEWLKLNEGFRYINTLIAGDQKDPGIALVGGEDGVRPTMSQLDLDGWSLYEDPEYLEVDVLVNAGYTDRDLQIRLDEIARLRADCMAILDVPSDKQTLEKAIRWRRAELALDSSYSAAYLPDVQVRDSYNDLRLYIPPSGCVAAAFAATDRDYATWFAPAGMNRGKITATAVAQTYEIGDRDALYENQLNVIRNFPGEGIRIFGADTLQVMASALSNINVRRLMLYVERALSKAVNYSVFDPNDEILWAKLDELCTSFLRPIQDGRGLYWFEVVCNDTNNTPETIASGDVMLDVYMDPVLPAKRIHLNATINKTGARVTASVA